jgi:hypothetical protein
MSLFDDLLNKAKPVDQNVVTPTPLTNTSTSAELIIQQDPLASNTNPIVVSNATPIITNTDIHEAAANTPGPMPIAPPVVEATSSLFITSEEPTNETVIINPGITENPPSIENSNAITFLEETTPEPTLNMETPPQESQIASPLFDTANETSILAESAAIESISLNETTPEEITPESTTNKIVEPETMFAELSVSQPVKEVSFRDTAEYIGHALEEVGVLITRLEAANDAKMRERDGYKDQKKHFAELEKIADNEHKVMLVEMEHAEKMHTYLETELKKSSTAANDETFALAA